MDLEINFRSNNWRKNHHIPMRRRFVIWKIVAIDDGYLLLNKGER